MSAERVALFVPSLRGGGAERVMLDLARNLTRQGFKVDLVLVKAEGPYLVQVPPGVSIVDLSARRVLLALPGLVRYLRRRRPVVLLPTMTHANLIALLAQRLSGVAVRVIVRESNTVIQDDKKAPGLIERTRQALTRQLYMWADDIVAPSEGLANNLTQRLGISKERVKVIYNPAISPQLLALAKAPLEHPWFDEGQPPVILGVGRLTAQKDFPTLVEAFAKVRKGRPAKLMILGEGEDRPKLEALIKESGLEGDAILPGFVDNPFAYMARAAVFVLSSRWEGLPNVLIQALAVGARVVATDCPSGPSEILEHGKFGRLVPLGDSDAMAQAVIDALSEASTPIDSSWVNKFDEEAIVWQYITTFRLHAVTRQSSAVT